MRRLPVFSVICLSFSVLFACLFRFVPGFSDVYRLRVFIPAAEKLRALSGMVAFPLAEATLFLMAAWSVFRLTVSAKSGAAQIVKGVSLMLVVYMLTWAPLYSCAPVIEAKEPSASELYAFCSEMIDSLNDLYMHPLRDDATLSDILSEAHSVMSGITAQALSPVKIARYPEIFTSLGIAGVYFPFTFESIINPDDIWETIPFTACHELAHQAGWAREEEASLIAWLACRRASSVFQYSGDFVMMVSAMEMLHAEDEISWKMCVDAMSPGVYRSFRSANGMNEAVESGMRRFQDFLTDAFLRLNGQNSGISGYDRAVWAAIAWMKGNDCPVSR